MSNEMEEDTMRPEYDFSGGVRGKHYEAYRKGVTIMVGIEQDVAKVFPDAEAVNQALRTLIRLMSAQAEKDREEHKQAA
ncbi:MAG: hypothetical protein KJ914_11265 [Gammaproteobacteria bacterium]|nr:hypothetical protein [Gammaproteobacteria bacterium]MBU1722370.1 hypothetical protein [Gammaproteobacteria bacterium]MBU2004693.1 hypothetical protein [Gammaproteobacteria bacterium]